MQAKTTNHERAHELIDTLKKKGPNAFGFFIEALNESGQEHIVETLLSSVDTASGPSTSSQSKPGKIRTIVDRFRHFFAPSRSSLSKLGIAVMPQKIRTIIDYLRDFYQRDCEIMKDHWTKLLARFPRDFEIERMYAELEIMEEDRSSGRFIRTYKELFGVMVEGGTRSYRKIVITGACNCPKIL